MNKHLIILALETLLEQVIDANDNKKITEIQEQIKIIEKLK
tara:strand:+ start:64 stop:186 length:123 start_codon:yes stop_codon:yes gene_type:complete